MTKNYYLHKKTSIVGNILDWESIFWRKAETARIDNFHPQSTGHHPSCSAKLQYDAENIYLLFKTDDKYIRSIYTLYNSKVNEDSCVEWFVKTPQAKGYYNLEINAGGTLHVNYIVDPERDKNGKRKDIRSIPENHASQIKIYSSLPRIIDPEIVKNITWFLAMIIPFEFFNLFTSLGKISSSVWQGNLYKCGDKTSHPHWASWNPVDELNFHQPKHFGKFIFMDD
ncbi:MAG: carbohydrate-binding family 9-like protein [Candidatus Marinimicrobia bacterium]|nr:carbohydrate-binding family 9-like protein [Candidatus Neomarinimicrobiota bacterium]